MCLATKVARAPIFRGSFFCACKDLGCVIYEVTLTINYVYDYERRKIFKKGNVRYENCDLVQT